jgi:hypothetical protein
VGPEVIANGGDRFGECWSLLAMEAAFLPVVRATICGWTARLATGAVSRSASRTGIGSMAQSASGQSFVRPLATLRHRLASGLVLPRSRLRSLRLPARSLPPSKKRNSASVPHAVFLSPSVARRRPRVGLTVRQFMPGFFLLAALVALSLHGWSALDAPANAAMFRDGNVLGDSGS